MPAPEQLTAYDASNPASTPGLLAQIAEHRPDLRPLVAANPATPADVLDRLARLGDVAVNAALARRDQQPGARPFAAPGGAVPAAPGAGGYAQPAPTGFAAPDAGGPGGGGYGTSGYGTSGYGTSGYGTPGAGAYGSPAYFPMPATTGYAGPGGPTLNSYAPPMGAGGYAPGYATAPGSWGAAPKRSRAPWIVGLVVAVLVAVVGVGYVGYWFVERAASVARAESTYGSDEHLDALWDACDAGDGEACDDLFWDSPSFSEYEDFGNTCGGREPDGIWRCADKYEAGPSGGV
ncbi:variant leucine-rich repeat-containing protein [Georgenia ruanii]|uniref:variant leucine-rich repeat-containing protein n=1 Tax=Georgenia ruanii TaxID=348442 RepID=UPI001263EEAD|nr:hypothetical protein [Georgenia ruanii]